MRGGKGVSRFPIAPEHGSFATIAPKAPHLTSPPITPLIFCLAVLVPPIFSHATHRPSFLAHSPFLFTRPPSKAQPTSPQTSKKAERTKAPHHLTACIKKLSDHPPRPNPHHPNSSPTPKRIFKAPIKYSSYVDIKGKIKKDKDSGLLTRVSRGLYETDKSTPGHFLAGYICGPSYLSFDFVLSRRGPIPEGVFKTFTSATYDKQKRKRFSNEFGTFLFCDVPTKAYPFGVVAEIENGYSFQIATPEKALCDKLYSLPPMNSQKAMKELLFDDLRIDQDGFAKLCKTDIITLAALYGSTNLKLLSKLLKGAEK